MTDIPQWAFERADELSFNDGAHINKQRVAFARYIAEHEDEPTDPLLLEAREICASFCERGGCFSTAGNYRDGGQDDSMAVGMVVAALKSREPQS